MADSELDDVFVGVDLGTSALKCGAWDRSGRRRAMVRRGYASGDECGASSSSPEIWLDTLVAALAELVAIVGPRAIAGLAIAGHAPSAVVCGPSFVVRAAATSAQHRISQVEFDRLCELEPRLRDPGDARLETWLHAHGRALLATRPDIAAADLDAVMTSWEFLIERATGVRIATTASAIDVAGIAGAPRSWRAGQRVPPGAYVAGSARSFAAATGLREGTPIVVGGIDSRLAAVGSGITELGEACINTGSSSTVAQLAPIGPWTRFEFAGMGLASEPIRLGARVLAPLLDGLGPRKREQVIGRALALPHAPLGSGPRHVLQEVEQALAAIAADHGLEYAVRAALERIALEQRRTLDSLAGRVGAARTVRVVGGLVADRRMHALICNALDRPIDIPTEFHASCLGAAMSAAVAIGAFDTLETAATAMTSIASQLTPGPERERLGRVYAELPSADHSDRGERMDRTDHDDAVNRM